MLGVRRTLSLLFSVLVAAIACILATDVFLSDGAQWLDFVRITLLAMSTAWLGWGAALALNGLLAPPDKLRARRTGNDIPEATVAVLVPVYNEDPAKSFSHVAAMARSVIEAGAREKFHFAILSDTNKDAIAQREEFWFSRLHEELGGEVEIFYRRRSSNPGKKAGNIADFIKTSGSLYEYLIILDADSLLEGETMLEMVRRMDADPELGLLQTLPKVIHARSLFGRAVQFSASFYSPVFAGGVAELQGTEGPFWGHNAIVRTRAFAQSCGLPELPGKPPFGGHILSHDYVEAALLARSGWKVRVDPDLEGSFEEGPDNVIDFAKRDRRWCQGNLQHSRVMMADGLKPWSRFVFLQGIMAYVASPIWAFFLAASIVAPVMVGTPDYFPVPGLPVFPTVQKIQALTLLTGVLGLLVGPKLLIVLRGMATGDNRAFGGNIRAFFSMVLELACSSILAPVMLMYQTRSVFQVILGADSGWPATNREAGAVSFGEAWAASWWICAAGLIMLGAAYQLAPDVVFWILFVGVPAIASPFLIQVTSTNYSGAIARRLGLLWTPNETNPSPVIRTQEAVLARWRSESWIGEVQIMDTDETQRFLASGTGR